MDYEFMHAAFPSRMDAGRSLPGKGKGKQKQEVGVSNALTTGALQASKTPCVMSRILRICSLIPQGNKSTSGFT